MNAREYKDISERLKRGETVEITDVAGFIRQQDNAELRRGMEAAALCSRPIGADDLNRILSRYGGNRTVWALFTRIISRYGVTAEALADGLGRAYILGAADRQTALLLFQSVEARNIMNADDFATFCGLPEALTIYRGADLKEQRRGVYGLSWTTDRETAEFFAWRFNPQDTGRAVFGTTIQKREALAYFGGRQEQEIIADVRGGVEVIAREPSRLFWDRMEKHRGGG